MRNASSKATFGCPTSGQMLGALVSAFRLHTERVGGPSSEFLGSGNAGKRARDYFEGKWVPEDTRHRICAWVIRGLVHSRIIPDLLLPTAPSGERPEVEETLRIALFTWLQIWDGRYRVPAERWHAADPALAGFVLGRQVVIDLALRWGALCQMAGITDPEAVAVEDGRNGKGKGIVEAAISLAGKAMTRDELADAIDRVRGTIKQRTDRTVDRWYDELVVPDDENLEAVAEVLADGHAELKTRLLRFLRLQYGGLRLAIRIRAVIGERLAGWLVDGLIQFVRNSIRFNQATVQAGTDAPEQDYPFEIATFKLLALGSGDPAAAGWINAWLSEQPGPIWHDDLQFAGNGATDARIAACFKVIGNWPSLHAAIAQRGGLTPNGSPEEQRQLCEFAAIMCMNDNRVSPSMAQWVAENSEMVTRIPGSNDAMKAAGRAQQATAAMHEGDHEGALPHWARAVALESDPHSKANYLFHYGACLWQAPSHRYDDALEALDQSFALWPADDPQRDRPFVEIAIIYQNRGWFEHAFEHLETDPVGFANTSGHFNYVKGRVLHCLHRHAEGLECFEQAIELKTGELAEAHAHAADCAFELATATGDRELSKKGRHHAKQALHLGRPWAHDKWAVG